MNPQSQAHTVLLSALEKLKTKSFSAPDSAQFLSNLEEYKEESFDFSADPFQYGASLVLSGLSCTYDPPVMACLRDIRHELQKIDKKAWSAAVLEELELI